MKKISEYMNIKEASKFLGVTPNTLRNWEKSHNIPVYRNPFNQYRLYDEETLKQLLIKIRPN